MVSFTRPLVLRHPVGYTHMTEVIYETEIESSMHNAILINNSKAELLLCPTWPKLLSRLWR
jgi:hypothetical protein